MVEVTAALIRKNDAFFICQRPEAKARALLWEFPGGKLEAGETGKDALLRECREELGIPIIVGDIFTEVTHFYPDITVHLTLYHATLAGEEPKRLEHKAFAWITPNEIDAYDFCPADYEILEKIKQEWRYLS